MFLEISGGGNCPVGPPWLREPATPSQLLVIMSITNSQ